MRNLTITLSDDQIAILKTHLEGYAEINADSEEQETLDVLKALHEQL